MSAPGGAAAGPSAPQVSVIMVCRDGARFLPEALASLGAQTLPDWELVFRDNGSTDGSADLARAADPRVRVLERREPVPLGAARREAVERSRGAYLAFLDHDDVWRADKLERQVRRMARRDVGLVYADCDVVAADGRPLGRYSRRVRPAEGWVRLPLIAENFMATCTVLLSRATYDTAGGFDPELNVADDYDLWLRVSRSWKVAFDADALATYRVHPGGLIGDFDEAYARNRAVYRRILDHGEASAEERAHARRALAWLHWRWAALALLEGRGPRAVVARVRDAWRIAPGPGVALADAARAGARLLRGLGLRLAMRRARR